jgi:hypothetical protein
MPNSFRQSVGGVVGIYGTFTRAKLFEVPRAARKPNALIA